MAENDKPVPDDVAKKMAEQAAYIAELEKEHEALGRHNVSSQEMIANLTAENERLKAVIAATPPPVDVKKLNEELAAAHQKLDDLERKTDIKPANMPEPKGDQPKRVRVTHAHGYMEEGSNRHRYWPAGTVVTDPPEIALLLERKAPLEAA